MKTLINIKIHLILRKLAENTYKSIKYCNKSQIVIKM